MTSTMQMFLAAIKANDPEAMKAAREAWEAEQNARAEKIAQLNAIMAGDATQR